MAKTYNNPVDLIANFRRLNNLPLDDSSVVDSQSDLTGLNNIYNGLLVYSESDKSFFFYDGTTWKDFASSLGGLPGGETGSIQVKDVEENFAGYIDFKWIVADKELILSKSSLKSVDEKIELSDETGHYMDLVGGEKKGLDPVNPTRFDIGVKNTVPTNKATFTLREDMANALMFIFGNEKIIQFVTKLAAPFVEFYQRVALKQVDSGDNTMLSLVLDSSTGEIKLYGTPNPTAEPTMSTNFATCGGVAGGNLEVGVVYNTTLTKSYYPGNIVSADGSPDIDLTGAATTYLYSGSGADGVTGIVSTVIVLGTNVWALSQDYDAGTGVYYDAASNPSTIFDAFRVAGNDVDNSNVITGAYKYWWSVGSIPTTSVGVRALTDFGFSPTSTFDIAIPAFETLVAFYLPDTAGTVTVWLVESNANITSEFTITAMNVDDAGGTSVGYNRYEQIIGGIGYSEDVTYNIVIT